MKYECADCKTVVEHPDSPSICDYWFINRVFVCMPCQRKRIHKQIADHIKKTGDKLFGLMS